eukprot:NODE_7979_length_539_cov_3.783673_g6933_i0.p2 GENE.NODE_7979_length_539_cov_3.783673_g6933_i0~~NODE_7979_length_539_cov_3.783673_g6933_i0.p2  ORF type:complete len:130 (-),score=20.17 NODE_7979_length_539_cov_3.783673_g6933_i0:79-468(-)
MDLNNDAHAVDPKDPTHIFWKFFQFLGGAEVACRVGGCAKVLSLGSADLAAQTKSNAVKHLKARHSEHHVLYEEKVRTKSSTLSGPVQVRLPGAPAGWARGSKEDDEANLKRGRATRAWQRLQAALPPI